MGLGSFRLVLSLWVIDHHYGLSRRLIGPVVVDTLGEENLGFLKIGHIAVISFFVLSGYVITWVLKNKYPHNSVGIKAFFLGRIIRIYPLYWASLAAMVAVLLLVPGIKAGQELTEQFSFWRIIGDFLLFPYGVAGFFLDKNFYVYGMINLPAWTLPYDLVFYLIAPWMVMKKIVLGSVIGLELMYLLALSFIAPNDSWHAFYLSTGHAQLLAFSVGSMVWYFRKTQVPVWLLFSAITFILYLVFVPYKMTNLYLNHFLVIFFTVFIILGLKKRSKLDDMLGELTYSTYLLHMPVMNLVMIVMVKYQSLAALVLTYIVSLFVVKYIESPLDKGRKRLTTQLLKKAEDMPEETSSKAVYITAAIFIFLLVSGGYNFYWISVNPTL